MHFTVVLYSSAGQCRVVQCGRVQYMVYVAKQCSTGQIRAVEDIVVQCTRDQCSNSQCSTVQQIRAQCSKVNTNSEVHCSRGQYSAVAANFRPKAKCCWVASWTEYYNPMT